MVEEHGALTVADLCSTSNESSSYTYGSRYESDDHSSTIDCIDDDSFLANNSLCKQHRSSLKMLDSLRKEVVQMIRSDGKNPYGTPAASPRDVMIDLTKTNAGDFSSPLGSPVNSRRNTKLSPGLVTPLSIPSLSNTENTTRCQSLVTNHGQNDDYTFCSMDDSINQEMNLLKEVATELEKELRETNINTVFEAIERIGESNNPEIKSVLMSEDRDVIREGIRNELQKEEFLYAQDSVKPFHVHLMEFVESFEGGSMNIKVLAVAIAFSLIRNWILGW